MFGDLVQLVKLFGSAATGVKKLKAASERREAVLGLLKTYFLLKDCVDEGEQLVLDAGADPIRKASEQSADEAIETLTQWDLVIRNQGFRLYELQGYVFGADHLAVIDPALQDRISEVVGSKMQRVTSLHGIGAALFFRNMFPIANTNEERARYVAVMAGSKGDLLNMERVASEISSLKSALDEYRTVIDKLMSQEEVLALSSVARRATPTQKA